MRIVAALGGNALLARGEAATADVQRRNVAVATRAIAGLARDYEIVVTHGNGPQVGLLALQAEAYRDVPAYPLDVLGAESEGMIGYLLEQGLENARAGRPVATLLTQVLVEGSDPAFAHPTKPIGPVYEEARASALALERGWTVAADGSGFRRVVASPEPRAIVELETIRLLLEAGVIVICAGGGGIPVVVDGARRLTGVEAVVDKDLASALLATQLRADALLLLTDVAGVLPAGGGDPIARIDVDALRALRLPAGSMGPKAEAACRFVEATGGRAAIGALAEARGLLAGSHGTQVVATLRPGPIPDQ